MDYNYNYYNNDYSEQPYINDYYYSRQQPQPQPYMNSSQPPVSSNSSSNPSGNSAGRRSRKDQPKLSPDNNHVIFLGFEESWNEFDLQRSIESLGGSIDSVSIIRDRSTGISKGYGFAQFTSVAHAVSFVKPRFPFINLPGSSLTQKIDFSASAQANESRRNGVSKNDGTRDIGNAPCRILLFRSLDFETTEVDVKNSIESVGAKPKRIVIIRDRETENSFGFGFVEFASTAAAQQFLASTLSPEAYPTGFRIQDKLIACTFSLEQSLSGLDGSRGHNDHIRYWDGTGHPSIIDCDSGWKESTKSSKKHKVDSNTRGMLEGIVPQGPPAKTSISQDQHLSKKPKVGKIPATAGPIKIGIGNSTSKPATASSNSTTNAPASKVKVTSILGQDDDSDHENDDNNNEDDKKPKKLPQLTGNKKVASTINKWNQKQDELRTDDNLIDHQSQQPRQQSINNNSNNKEEFDYTDLNKMACLLCQRQFKTVEVLMKHCSQSDLHKNNLKNESACEIGKQKKINLMNSSNDNTPKYRDRASERREIFGQPENPNVNVNKRKFEDNEQNQNQGQQQEESQIGKSLLEKMGWKSGSGLGYTNEGRVDPIETLSYESKAGLGASKGRDIAQAGRGYLENVKLAAKERYEQEHKQT